MSRKVLILSGSPNLQSRLYGVLDHATGLLAARDVSISRLDVVSLPAEALIFGRFDDPAVREANARVEQADALIIASPVYKASYTGVLKTYLDLLPQGGLAGKTITPIFIGGTIAHLLSIDYSLKPVLSALGARRFTNAVYAVDQQVLRTETSAGQVFELQEELKARIASVVDELSTELGLQLQKV
jgi:FMN reductase